MKLSEDDIWYESFWSRLGEHPDNEDNGLSAIRLIGEMFRKHLLYRNGDDLIGRDENVVVLTPGDQFLIRVIEDASAEAHVETLDYLKEHRDG